MLSRLPRNALATVTLAVLTAASPAFAADNVVQPAPAPAPAAGPTLEAASGFCGEASGKAEELFERYSADGKLQEVYKSNDYIAFADDPKNPTVMYTFTQKAHAAHPAAVCRKPEKVGDNLVIKMSVVCDGEQSACTKLKNDFNVMTAKMQAEVDQKIKSESK